MHSPYFPHIANQYLKEILKETSFTSG